MMVEQFGCDAAGHGKRQCAPDPWMRLVQQVFHSALLAVVRAATAAVPVRKPRTALEHVNLPAAIQQRQIRPVHRINRYAKCLQTLHRRGVVLSSMADLSAMPETAAISPSAARPGEPAAATPTAIAE